MTIKKKKLKYRLMNRKTLRTMRNFEIQNHNGSILRPDFLSSQSLTEIYHGRCPKVQKGLNAGRKIISLQRDNVGTF